MKHTFFASLIACATLLGWQPANAETLYSARKGDTLPSVARSHHLSTDELARVNPAQSKVAQLAEGVILVIPDSGAEAPAAAEAAAPRATAVRIEGRSEVAAASGDEEEFVLDRSGSYGRRITMSSRHGRLLSGITRSAHHLIGVPYVFGGTSDHGIDCSGFTMRVFGLHGIRLPRTADVQYGCGSPVGRGKEEAGDLVFFETYCPGPSHVGIYLGGGTFIHASSSRGVTISNLSDSYYKSRYLGAKRVF